MRARHVLAALGAVLIAPVLVLMVGIAPAAAGAACNIELSAGVGVEDTAVKSGGTTLADLASKGALGGVGFGCDVVNASTKVGGLVRYSVMNVSGDVLGANLDADGLWEVAAKMAWRLNDKFDVYGLAGWSGQNKLKLTSSGPSVSAGDRSGLLLGLGAEVKLSGPWSLRGEYTWHNFDSGAIGSTGLTAEPDLHVVRAALVYTFGGGSSIFTNVDDNAPAHQPLK